MIEYKVVTLRNNDTVDTDDLNALAREGWRVVACAHVSGQGIATILARGEPLMAPLTIEPLPYVPGTAL